MIAYRLAKAAYTALDGEGARLYGGRWNSPGRPMIYTAASPSLAVLEVLVHLDLTPNLLPDDYRLLSIEIPDSPPFEQVAAPPADPAECLRLGDGFLIRGAALGLQVRSVVVPQESNLLLNPKHAAAARLRIAQDEPFVFDPRLVGGA